ncbi:hypothetical protein [Microbacterium murale]|uniref:MFS family permease n=1 Tax=Microbacterium murale TaxID=1081040 RepID=A0ABU0PAN8_9MICO|nr:hypothetical protein [Microbacterium murale]MDQ0644402.1 MFS family permease [Microbacterium murale]
MDSIRTERTMVTALHGFTGLLTALWGAGLPSLDARLSLGPGGLAIVLLVLAAGASVAMPVAGRLAGRVTHVTIVRSAFPAAAVSLGAAGAMPSFGALIAATALFGVASGTLNVGLSASAMSVERAAGRPVIARMHGYWTLGAAGGGLVVSGLLHIGLDARVVTAAGAVAIAAVASLLGRALASTHDLTSPAQVATVPQTRMRREMWGWTAALGALGTAAFIAEGAAVDWAGVHATHELGATPATGSLMYALFFGAMTIMRFTGDRLRSTLGARRTLRLTGVIGACGYFLVILSPSLPSGGSTLCAATGWFLTGAGAALVWPITIGTLAAAGVTPGVLSIVATISYGGGLIGPALIGVVAEFSSLTAALAIPLALALAVSACAPAIIDRFQSNARPIPSPASSTQQGESQ